MKPFILGLGLLLFSANLFAQTSSVISNAEKATQELTNRYQLNQMQISKVMEIQKTHFRNLEQVETIKQSNNRLYVQKLKNLATITNGSVRNLLNPSQLALFKAQELDRKQQRQERIKKMKAEGASKEEIQKVISGS